MTLPDLHVLLFALMGAFLGCAVVLLVIGLRGVVVEPGKPPTRTAQMFRSLRDPKMGLRLGLAVGVFALVLVLTRWPAAALALGALVIAWPSLFGGSRLEKQQIARLEALVMWTESLRDTMAGHASLEQAVPAASINASELLRPALVRLRGLIRARVPMDQAFEMVAAEWNDGSADKVLAALMLNARRRGDRLGNVLSGLTVTARQELDMRRQISAGRAELRRGVQIVVIMTLVFAAFLVMFGGAYVAPYSTPGGQLALVVVAGMFAAGFAWMRKLSGSDPAAPFLARPDHVVADEDIALIATLSGVDLTDPAESGPRASRRLGRKKVVL